MELIADSGSTKTTWYLRNKNKLKVFNTIGFNPYFFNVKELTNLIDESLFEKFNFLQIEKIFFFGSGCSNQLSIDKVTIALASNFRNAQIKVGDDLLAACLATSNYKEGICCILGTGSNSCYFDGTSISYKIPSLGYILGDEGSGSYIGRKIVSSYFYKEMPSALSLSIEKEFVMDKHSIIEKLINGARPNSFLASFADFCISRKDDLFIKKIIKSSFSDFISRHLMKYKNIEKLPVHFIGSVAYGYQNILNETLMENNIIMGKVLKTPFPELLTFV